MTAQDQASFGQALRAALHAADINQAELARALPINQGQVSRWVTGKATPLIATVRRIDEILNSNLARDFDALTPKYELYVSAPITGLDPDAIEQHHDDVEQVVAAAREHVNSLYWPGEGIRSLKDLVAPDIATENNLKALAECSAYLYVQFAEVIHPTSSLVEFGFALGRRLKTTFIVGNRLPTPFMLEGFQGVARGLSFLPKARIYPVPTVDEAVTLISRSGRELLGLGQA